MEIGKIPGKKLQQLVLDKINYKHPDVLIGAGLGEDSAVVDLGDDLLVVSSDPITGASKDSGRLAVHVACNDLAATGAKPVGIQLVLLLPEGMKDKELSKLMSEIVAEAHFLEVEVLGGHTEVLSTVQTPLIVVTAIGRAKPDRYVSSKGARPGDALIVTKGVGIEGTYILANDYESLLKEKGVAEEVIASARKYGDKISVLKEGLIAAEFGVNAMHDITEGGLYGALEEMSKAADVGFNLKLDDLPVSRETKEICKALEIDPAGLISSGSMLIVTRSKSKLIKLLADEGIDAYHIGNILPEGKYIIENGKKKEFKWDKKDELWRLMEQFPNIS